MMSEHMPVAHMHSHTHVIEGLTADMRTDLDKCEQFWQIGEQ